MSTQIYEGFYLNKTFYLAAAAVLALSLTGCGNKSGEEVAVVNGESIGREDLHSYLETKMNFLIVVPGQQTIAVAQLPSTPAFQALLDLITQKVTMQIAKDEGVEPKPADVEEELSYRKKLDPNYATVRMANGISMGQIKDQIGYELAQERIISKGITVDANEAKQYITDNPVEFTNPEEVELYYIVVSSPEKKKKVDDELAIGKPFQAVASSLSEAPTARDDRGKVNPGRPTFTKDLQPALKKMIEKTGEGKQTEWIKDATNWLRFYVEKRKPAKKIPVDDVLVQRVQRMLQMQKGQLAIDLQKRVRDKVLATKFDIKDKDLKNQWDRYIAQLKRATEQAIGTPGN